MGEWGSCSQVLEKEVGKNNGVPSLCPTIFPILLQHSRVYKEFSLHLCVLSYK